MKKIIVIDDNESICHLICDLLKVEYPKNKVISFSSGNSFISYMKEESPKDIIVICDYMMFDGDGLDVATFLNQYDPNFSMLLISTSTIDREDLDLYTMSNSNYSYLEKIDDFSKILNSIQSSMGAELSDREEYIEVPVNLLYIFETAIIPIFIHLSGNKYIKFIEHHSELDDEIKLRVKNKGMQSLWIRKEDYAVFLEMVQKVKIKTLPQDKEISIQLFKLNECKARMIELGVDDDLKDVVSTVVNDNLKMINETKELKTLLKNLLYNNEMTLEHAMAVLFVSTVLLKKVSWHTVLKQKEFAIASMFHNITIKDLTGDNLNYEGMYDLDTQSFIESKNHFLSHMNDSASILMDLEDNYGNFINLITNHHERPFGRGFPRGLTGAQTADDVCLFNTAHFFVTHMFINGWSKDGLLITLKSMESLFQDEKYDEYYKILKNFFRKKKTNP